MIKINKREVADHISDNIRRKKTIRWSLKMPVVKVEGFVVSEELIRSRRKERS